MRIALVDDDKIQLQQLELMLREATDKLGIAVRQIETYTSPEAFLSGFHAGDWDIILLDIYMGEENGVELARRIRELDGDAVLAFCTSSNEFAAESYEVGAGYYLQKPISAEKLTACLRRLDLSKLERDRTLRLPDGSQVLLRRILYTEYHNHTVKFHLKNTEPRSVYMNHLDAEEMLLHYKQFGQANKGCIVNFAMVQTLSDGVFRMKNGETVPISRRRYKELSEAYTKYHFERMNREVDE